MASAVVWMAPAIAVSRHDSVTCANGDGPPVALNTVPSTRPNCGRRTLRITGRSTSCPSRVSVPVLVVYADTGPSGGELNVFVMSIANALTGTPGK